MLIYEKNNKLNINFDPSKSIEGIPDIQFGENEIKLGDAEITSENVLPTPTNDDVGKVLTVQENGTYSLDNVPAELPSVSASDNGKVLSVVGGKWNKANASSGSNPLIVNVSFKSSKYTMNASFSTIQNAFDAGRTVVVKNGTIHGIVVGLYVDSDGRGGYVFVINGSSGETNRYVATSPDAYPSISST